MLDIAEMHESKRLNRYAVMETPPVIDLRLVNYRIPANPEQQCTLSCAFLDPISNEIVNLIVGFASIQNDS